MVQVKGKNGKIFSRMQWVDPNDESANIRLHSHEDVPEKTQKEHIDEHVKNMSREDKYAHLSKHGVTWTRNDKSDAIDHKNAVMALKDHLYKNPHLAGAEHLPTERDATDTEVINHAIKKFTDKYKNHPELLHKMMHHLGVADTPDDPRIADKSGGAIKHMRRMVQLKALLKSKPEHMDHMMSHPEYGEPFGDADRKGHTELAVKKVEPKPEPKPEPQPEPTPEPKVEPEPKPEPKLVINTDASKPNLATALKKVSRENLYSLMKELGIAEGDPKIEDPSASSNILHMRYMMKLKSAIEGNPDILSKLGLSPDSIALSGTAPSPSTKTETPTQTVEKPKKEEHEVDEVFSRMSKEDKEEWIEKMRNHALIGKRVNSGLGTPQNYIHALHAVKELFKKHPDVWADNKEQAENDALVGSTKISNEDMTIVLRQLVGLKEGLNKERATSGFRKQQSWEFSTASTAEILKNDDGKAVLSIIDAGFSGDEFNEIEVPLQEVLNFLKERKEKKGTASPTKEAKGKDTPITETLPLHKRGAGEMWKAIVNDSSVITPEVAKALGKDIYAMWSRTGFTRDYKTLAVQGGRNLPSSAVEKVLQSLGIPLRNEGSSIMEVDDENFKRAVYSHLIQKSKDGDARDLVINNRVHSNDTWVLHESAKHWNDEERTSARHDFIKPSISIKGANEHILKDKGKLNKLTEFLHRSTSYIPFDMMTDLMAKGFVSINFDDGVVGSHYDAEKKAVYLHNKYLHASLDPDARMEDFHHEWEEKAVVNGKEISYKLATHQFADTTAHEFAHAIDHFMSGGFGYLNWSGNANARKYVESLNLNPNMVKDSYLSAVRSSNPNFTYVLAKNGKTVYPMHLDTFINSYEGRVYEMPVSGKQGEKYEDPSKGKVGMIGLEHWSEGVSRVVNAVRAHKEHVAKTGSDMSLDEWAENMYHDRELYRRRASMASKTGDLSKEHGANKLRANGEEGEKTFGKAYHVMKHTNPELLDSIHKMFFRGDFVDHVQKSEFLYILDGRD